MKIAMVSMNADPLACLGGVESGGQSVVIDCLSRALSGAGHAVSIFTQRADPALPACTTAAGVYIDRVGTERDASPAAPDVFGAIEAFAEHLAAAWRLSPPDVVHAHSWMSGKAAIAAGRPLGIPVVQTFHGLGRPKRGRADTADLETLRVDEEIALIRAAARIVATSSSEVFALLGLGASPGAIKIIPCGVDLDTFAPATRLAPRSGRPFRVATLSRLVPDAGVGDVIEALTYVPDVELVVGGGRCDIDVLRDDPDAQALVALAAARGVSSRVTFVGQVKRADVAAFLQSADAVVCAPWRDAVGTVVLEAMACGVPVIASSVGGHLDAVAEGISGMHVPPRAPRQIAYAIESLAADAPLRERFSRFGIERTSARYGWPRIAGEMLEVYMKVVSRAPQLTSTSA